MTAQPFLRAVISCVLATVLIGCHSHSHKDGFLPQKFYPPDMQSGSCLDGVSAIYNPTCWTVLPVEECFDFEELPHSEISDSDLPVINDDADSRKLSTARLTELPIHQSTADDNVVPQPSSFRENSDSGPPATQLSTSEIPSSSPAHSLLPNQHSMLTQSATREQGPTSRTMTPTQSIQTGNATRDVFRHSPQYAGLESHQERDLSFHPSPPYDTAMTLSNDGDDYQSSPTYSR